MSEKIEKYTIEQALEEAENLKKKIDSGEVSSYVEAEKQLGQEMEISPNQIEKIMEKVIDVEQEGIAYHSLGINKYIKSDPEKFKSLIRGVLLRGLSPLFVGASKPKEYTEESQPIAKDLNAEEYRDAIRENKKPSEPTANKLKDEIMEGAKIYRRTTYFNILGRSFRLMEIDRANRKIGDQLKSPDPRIRGVHVAKNYWSDGPIVLFNLHNLSEVSRRSDLDKRHTYKINDEGGVTKLINDNKYAIDSRHGFKTQTRIPPRNFIGLVINTDTNPYWTREEYFDRTKNPVQRAGDEFNPDEIKKNILSRATAIVESLQDNPQKLLPIYDSFGNLVWPQEMSYEEVKKMVTKKDDEDQEDKSPFDPNSVN